MTSRTRWLLLVLALLTLAAGMAWQANTPSPQTVPPELARSLWPMARPIPAFTLDRASGGVFTRADFEGRWSLVYFGYLQCPDVCPTTLAHMAAMKRRLESSGATGPQLVFVSVDPDRDAAESIRSYTRFFDESIVGLRADAAVLRPIADAFGVFWLERQGTDGSRSIEHTTAVMLVSPDAAAVAGIALTGRPDVDSAHLAQLMARVAR